MTVKLSGPMLPAKSGHIRQLMVLLHGYGASGSDLIALGGHWRSQFPDMVFVSPDAPFVCDQNPGGFQWYPLSGSLDLARREGTAQARPVIINFLIDLWAQTGLSAKDTVLAGFSQGATMALHVGLALDQPVAGVLAFSGLLVPPDQPWVKPPVAIIHGDLDGVVPPSAGEFSSKTLKENGFEVGYHRSPGTGHGISPDGLEFATQFLAARLGTTA